MDSSTNLYIAFVNAFSYTVAVAAVDAAIDTSQNDLILLAATIGTGVVLVGALSQQIAAVHAQFANGSRDVDRILHGPAAMLLYTLGLMQRIAVHFLSTVLGKWAITSTDSTLNIQQTMPTVIIAIGLLWLLGGALGINNV